MSFIFIFLIMLINYSPCQIDPQFSFYNYTTVYNNPAYSGIDRKISFILLHRSQWLNYQPTNAKGYPPTTQLISLSIPDFSRKSGFGLYITNDALANIIRNNNLMLSYAYHQNLSPKSILAVGIKGGIFTSKIDGSSYIFNDLGDPLINTGIENFSTTDLGAGIAIYNSRFNVGFSLSHINTLLHNNFDRFGLPMLAVFNFGTSFHINEKWIIYPGLIVKSTTNIKSITANIGSFIEYEQKFWIGLTSRYQESINFLAGINLLKENNLKVGYGFDYVTSNTKAKSPTSHEVMLLLSFEALHKTAKPPIRTPRYRF